MRYMLMMNAPRAASGEYQVNNWAPEDFTAHIAFMNDFNKELTAAGEWVDGQGLASPGQAKLVRASKNGGPPVTDGVFPETKEFLAGYWIVEVDSEARAHTIAAKASTAPGPGGAPLYMSIEVRQVMSGPPQDA
jgi:hypothetical protein